MLTVNAKSISPAVLANHLAESESLELLDVRTPSEYANAHVPGAKLMPLNELNIQTVLAVHAPGAPLYVLCQGGERAGKAIEMMERAGCEDCVLVEGGTQAWINAGFPVHRGASKVLPLIRQVQIVVGTIVATGAILTLTVDRWFAVIPLLLGCGLCFAGVTGFCGMALLLARMPWNRKAAACADCCTER
jgi:rhodanese-related sulfurtransferase